MRSVSNLCAMRDTITCMNILYIVIGICVVWSVWRYVSSRVERAEYTVLEKRGTYEVRLYPPHIVAQTTVKGSYQEALSEGFRIVAGYIFGGNTKKESIAMTTPVTEKSVSGKSESIAMTAPVVATVEGEHHIIAFGMPRSYTRETLPQPDDARVQIVSVPEKKMAAIQFSWFRTEAHVSAKKEELLRALAQDGVSVLGVPEYAGYNAPWTPPWMTRHEVMIEVK